MSIKNTLAALDYLRGKGWKVSQSKLYADVKAGKILKQPEGGFLEADLDRYAETHLERLDGTPAKPVVDLNEQKARAAARRLGAQAELAELELAKKKGELIEVEKVHAELASRAQVLKADLVNLAHAEASALARMTDPEAITRHLVERIETFLDRYASEAEFLAELTA